MNMADKIKLAVAALLLIGGIAGFYYFGDSHSLLVRVIGLLAVAGICVAIVWQTEMGRALLVFFGEAQIELRKVVWPTGKETTQTTLIVMAMVVLVAIFLWGVDSFLLWSVKSLTGQGG